MEVIKPKRKDVEFKENRENGQQKKQVYKSRAAIEEARRKLPIYESRQKIVDTIRNNPVTVIIGETGSGKTTQVPQFLYEAGFLNDKKRKEGKDGEANGGMMIGITQPRRVAATSVARRVSEEMGVKMGREVGYSIRFEDFTSKETKIKYLTDGMLIREAMLDNALSRYKVIIIDEAHERSLRTDILLGVLKQKIEASGSGNNQDFRVVIMSATINAELFSNYYGGCPILYVSGRMHDVRIYYSSEALMDYIDAAISTVLQIHMETVDGDILVFLSGQEEIENMEQLLEHAKKYIESNAQTHKNKELSILKIYAALPQEEQDKIFELTKTRKVILATNIAETSITLPRIKYVVDCGVNKVKKYNHVLKYETLQVEPITRTSARQRAGRAGRTSDGECYRLYPESYFVNEMEEDNLAEIKVLNLTSIVLSLSKIFSKDSKIERGIVNELLSTTDNSDNSNGTKKDKNGNKNGNQNENKPSFKFIEKPKPQAVKRAIYELVSLGAIKVNGSSEYELTTVGNIMADLPLDNPLYAKLIIDSKEFKCTKEVIELVSILSIESNLNSSKNTFFSGSRNLSAGGGVKSDHWLLIKALNTNIHNNSNKRSIKMIKKTITQISKICEKHSIPPTTSCNNDVTIFLSCLINTYKHSNIAFLQPDGKSFKTLSSNTLVKIHPSSSCFYSVNGNKKYTSPIVIFDSLIYTNKLYMKNVSFISNINL